MDIVITAQLVVPENDLKARGLNTTDTAALAAEVVYALEPIVPPEMREGLNVIAERRNPVSGPDIDAL